MTALKAVPRRQTQSPVVSANILYIALDDIVEMNPYQPRRTFDPEELEDLAASIKEHGVLQNILVRPLVGGGYQLVFGERRYRASRIANRDGIPSLVRELSDIEASKLALTENIQDKSLNPLEEARGMQSHVLLMAGAENKHITEADICNEFKVGPKWVQSRKAALRLPADLQQMIERNGPVLSHALQIKRLPEHVMTEDGTRTLRGDLIDKVDKGLGYDLVEKTVRDALVRYQESEARRKQAQSPPDSHTAQMQRNHENGITISRGKMITPDKARQAPGEILNGLEMLRRGASHIASWQDYLDDAAFERTTKEVREIFTLMGDA